MGIQHPGNGLRVNGSWGWNAPGNAPESPPRRKRDEGAMGVPSQGGTTGLSGHLGKSVAQEATKQLRVWRQVRSPSTERPKLDAQTYAREGTNAASAAYRPSTSAPPAATRAAPGGLAPHPSGTPSRRGGAPKEVWYVLYTRRPIHFSASSTLSSSVSGTAAGSGWQAASTSNQGPFGFCSAYAAQQARQCGSNPGCGPSVRT